MVRAAGMILAGGMLLGVPALADDSHFGPEHRVLKAEVVVTGSESWSQGKDHEKAQISHKVYFATVIRPIIGLSTVNALDPQFAEKQMATAARVQQKVQAAQQRHGTASPGLDQQKMMALAMQIQQTCKGDDACAKREAMKLMPQMMAGAGMAVPPQAMAMAGQGSDEEDADERERFQDWHGFGGCATRVRGTVKTVSEGALSDVAGMVPIRRSRTAEFDGLVPSQQLLCLANQMVLDIDTKTLYRRGFGMPVVPGTGIIIDGKNEMKSPEEFALPEEVQEWVNQAILQSPLSGSKSATLPLKRAHIVMPYGGAKYQGSVKVTLTWSFTDVVPAKTTGPQLPAK